MDEWNTCACGILVRVPDLQCDGCRRKPAPDSGTKGACVLRRNYNTKGEDAVPGYRSDCSD
jgi:hypothetical protein